MLRHRIFQVKIENALGAIFRKDQHGLPFIFPMAVLLRSYTLQGLRVHPVQVEVSVSAGMPLLSIIGMAAPCVQESRDRVRGSITTSGYSFPMTRKVVNLAPAEVQKSGSHFDLPIALGILVASGQMPLPGQEVLVLGELGLDGSLRPVRGVLPAILKAREFGIRAIVLPWENLPEASLVHDLTLYPAENLRQVVEHFSGSPLPERREPFPLSKPSYLEITEVLGHSAAKRALLVAAAGGHHIEMSGPPGSGKSLLAQAFPSLLPPLSPQEALEVLAIYSVAGKLEPGVAIERPFRAVHSRATAYNLFGGGPSLAPGEVTLAHRGVLFMDELPEFQSDVLEGLREPLEGRALTLRYGKMECRYPCQFQLVAARNPCPCGYFGDPEQSRCQCRPYEVQRYQQKVSGPVLDRIDLHLSIPRLSYASLQDGMPKESAEALRLAVRTARELQSYRWKADGILLNQEMGPKLVRAQKLTPESEQLLKQAAELHLLSGRAVHRIIKVARTLADLSGEDSIQAPHIAEALSYRVT